MNFTSRDYGNRAVVSLVLATLIIWTGTLGAASESAQGPHSSNTDQPTRLFTGQAAFNLSADAGGQLFFFINVPDGASLLDIQTLGGTGDADLFVRFNALATDQQYDCASTASGNNERCTFQLPPAGRYFILLDAWTPFDGVTLQANYQTSTPYRSIDVTKTGDGDGTIQSQDGRIFCGPICSASYSTASTVTLNVTADAGSEFIGWSSACLGAGSCTLPMNSAHEVTASFRRVDPPEPEPIQVDATYSGLWFNPEQDGHGLSITVHSPQSATIFWYTYDPFGTPIWILGAGEIHGNRIEAQALYFYGMKFGDWDTEEREMREWGQMEIEFDSCDSGSLRYESELSYDSGEEFGTGQIPLVRLASVDWLECAPVD